MIKLNFSLTTDKDLTDLEVLNLIQLLPKPTSYYFKKNKLNIVIAYRYNFDSLVLDFNQLKDFLILWTQYLDSISYLQEQHNFKSKIIFLILLENLEDVLPCIILDVKFNTFVYLTKSTFSVEISK